MNRIQKATASTKNFVARNKTTLAVTATAIVAVVLHVKVVNQHNEFLKEHDLFELFYRPTDEYV